MSDESQALENSSFEAADNAPTETPVVDVAPKAEQEKVVAPAAVDPMKVILDRLDKYEASHNTLAGHVGGINRNQVEMKALLAAAQAATSKVSDAPTQAQVREAIKDPVEWAALKEEHPHWADATEKMSDARQALSNAALDKKLSEQAAAASEKLRMELVNSHLDAIVDGKWRESTNSPEFAKWIASQPDAIKELGDSLELTDAAKMLRLFSASKLVVPASIPAPSKELAARQKRIESAVTPRGSGGNSSTLSTDIDYMEAGYSG